MLSKFFCEKHNKAQIGKTITWFFATLVILVILIISILATNFYFGGEKKVGYIKSADVLASKSFFSYLLTTENGKRIYEQLKNEGDFNNFNGALATNIFKEFYEQKYGGEYQYVWMGFKEKGNFPPYLKNNYFGNIPHGVVGGDINYQIIPELYQGAHLDENKSFELVLGPEIYTFHGISLK